jgi:hypothetical protein
MTERSFTRRVVGLAALTGVVVAVASAKGCGSSRESAPAGGSPGIAAAPTPEPIAMPAGAAKPTAPEPPRYEPLPREGSAVGGRVTVTVPGTPEQALAMLLDSDADAANRPWRSSCRTLSREGNIHRCEGAFGDGLLAVRRILRYEVTRSDGPRGGFAVRFRVENPGLGMTRFDGGYSLVADERGTGTVLTESLHIDSGTAFRPVSQDEVRDGLLEDAERMRGWMVRRLGLMRPAASAPSGSTLR